MLDKIECPLSYTRASAFREKKGQILGHPILNEPSFTLDGPTLWYRRCGRLISRNPLSCLNNLKIYGLKYLQCILHIVHLRRGEDENVFNQRYSQNISLIPVPAACPYYMGIRGNVGTVHTFIVFHLYIKPIGYTAY